MQQQAAAISESGVASRLAQAESLTTEQVKTLAGLEAERASLSQQLAVSQLEIAELQAEVKSLSEEVSQPLSFCMCLLL